MGAGKQVQPGSHSQVEKQEAQHPLGGPGKASREMGHNSCGNRSGGEQ